MWCPSRWQLWEVLAGATLLSVLIVACGEEEDGRTATPTATPTSTATATAAGTPAPTGTATATASPAPTATPVLGPPLTEGHLTFQVGTDKEVYQPGEPVAITLIITASESATLYYRTSQRFEFAVADGDRQGVWRWSSDRAFLQVLGQEVVEPGVELAYRQVWRQTDSKGIQVPPGHYTVTAESTHCDEDYDDCGGVVPFTIIEVAGR